MEDWLKYFGRFQSLKKWGKEWYYIGIAETLIFIILWLITRMPGNPITERGGSISGTGITVEIFQLAFIILSVIILVKDRFKSLTKTERLNNVKK